MRELKKIFTIICITGLVAACNLDYFPSDESTAGALRDSYNGLVYATDGNYSMFKDPLEYKGTTSSSYSYLRRQYEMAEYPSDEIVVSGRTTSTLFQAYTYERNASLQNVSYVWWSGYKIIYGANFVIDAIENGTSEKLDYLKGENLFLRAIVHLQLVNLYAKPYSYGRENPGIVIRNSSVIQNTERASVGEVYDQIEKDLTDAIKLMQHGTRRGNAGYASKEAAQGLLTRVYLHMGKYQEVIDLVDEMLDGATAESKLESTGNFPNYFKNALNSKETLWAVAMTTYDSQGQSNIGSMYLNDGIGWGEVFSSDPMNDLYEKNPNDIRYGFVLPQYLDETKWMIRYPMPGTDYRDARSNNIIDVQKDLTNQFYFMDDNNQKITIQTENVEGYTKHFIMLNGIKTQVRLTKKMQHRNSFPLYYITKYSYQDGDPMLSSPVMIRWAEVILNRAEAYANIPGKESNALADVNIIRNRAGLSGNQLFSTSNMQGYNNVLDVVLEERHLELAFEGHRTLDVYRNKKNLNREYAGVHTWEIINYNDNKVIYPIPFDEISVSGIVQNPDY